MINDAVIKFKKMCDFLRKIGFPHEKVNGIASFMSQNLAIFDVKELIFLVEDNQLMKQFIKELPYSLDDKLRLIKGITKFQNKN